MGHQATLWLDIKLHKECPVDVDYFEIIHDGKAWEFR